eukprot:6456747-Amphidinium_carterae.2
MGSDPNHTGHQREPVSSLLDDQNEADLNFGLYIAQLSSPDQSLVEGVQEFRFIKALAVQISLMASKLWNVLTQGGHLLTSHALRDLPQLRSSGRDLSDLLLPSGDVRGSAATQQLLDASGGPSYTARQQ